MRDHIQILHTWSCNDTIQHMNIHLYTFYISYPSFMQEVGQATRPCRYFSLTRKRPGVQILCVCLHLPVRKGQEKKMNHFYNFPPLRQIQLLDLESICCRILHRALGQHFWFTNRRTKLNQHRCLGLKPVLVQI